MCACLCCSRMSPGVSHAAAVHFGFSVTRYWLKIYTLHSRRLGLNCTEARMTNNRAYKEQCHGKFFVIEKFYFIKFHSGCGLNFLENNTNCKVSWMIISFTGLLMVYALALDYQALLISRHYNRHLYAYSLTHNHGNITMNDNKFSWPLLMFAIRI